MDELGGEGRRRLGSSTSAEHIPFPETRAYVENVMERRGEYRDNYADDLGL